MADTYLRIIELDEQNSNNNGYYLMLDSADWAEAKKMTVQNFLELEATPREDADDLIALNAGLTTNYLYQPDSGTYYLKANDFVTAGLDANLFNADKILDGRLYYVENKLYLDVCQTLTSAELQAINTSPVLAVAAPPAGYILDCIGIFGYNDHGGIDYVGSALELQCNSQIVAQMDAAFVTASGDLRKKGTIIQDVELTPATEYYWTAAADYTNGNGTFNMLIHYQVLDADFNCITSPTYNNCCIIPFTQTFTNGDLTGASKLVITHNRSTQKISDIYTLSPTGVLNVATFSYGDDSGNDLLNKVTLNMGGPIAAGVWTAFFHIIP